MSPLESVPDSEKDWHPGSDGKVLDLVHPSLFPVIYGLTCTTSGETIEPPENKGIFSSQRFQWLPSDFYVADDGSVSLKSPYINNIHPEDHAALHNVVPKIVERAVPLFEWVLSDLARNKQLPTRMDLHGKKFPSCVWADGVSNHCSSEMVNADLELVQEVWPDEDEEAAIEAEVNRLEQERRPEDPYVYFDRIVRFKFYDRQPKKWPDSLPAYDGGLNDVKKTITLRGRTLQLIVKLANIVLTPEKPEYPGGKWHVEGVTSRAFPEQVAEHTLGMDNEAIVATFIYVSPSVVALR